MDNTLCYNNTRFQHKQEYLSTQMSLFYWTQLKIVDIMCQDVVTMAPENSIQEAARIMIEKQISCILVCDDGKLVGILSQKDLLNSAKQGESPASVCVRDRMSSPVKTTEPHFPVLYASMVMEEMGIKQLPVVSDGRLLGIVTQTDLVQALESLSALRSVGEIMSKNVATITPDQSVAQAVDLMTQRRISCVLVTHHGKAEGILTEKDVLRLVTAQGRDPYQTCIVDVMSFPLFTITTSHSVLSASRIMNEKHIHRLIVADDTGDWGVVTRTDILRGYQTYAQRETQQGLYMLTHAKDAIVLLDSQGKTTYVNPAFLRLFELDSPELFLGQTFPPDAMWVEEQGQLQFHADQKQNPGDILQLLLRKAGGEYISLNLCFSDITDVKGHVIGRQGVAWDFSQNAI